MIITVIILRDWYRGACCSSLMCKDKRLLYIAYNQIKRKLSKLQHFVLLLTVSLLHISMWGTHLVSYSIFMLVDKGSAMWHAYCENIN